MRAYLLLFPPFGLLGLFLILLQLDSNRRKDESAFGFGQAKELTGRPMELVESVICDIRIKVVSLD